MSSRDTRSRLLRRAAKADILIPPATADGLAAFLDLLNRWNRKINLTALQDLDEAIDRLLLEPLAAARHLPLGGGRLVDVGSGGGSPAIPFALALPGLHVTMIEIKTRKSAFLREAIRVLDLSLARVETARFEDLLDKPEHQGAFGAVSLRAVRAEGQTLRRLAGFLAPGGALLLFRGPTGPDAMSDVPPLTWKGTHPLIESLRSRLTVYQKS